MVVLERINFAYPWRDYASWVCIGCASLATVSLILVLYTGFASYRLAESNRRSIVTVEKYRQLIEQAGSMGSAQEKISHYQNLLGKVESLDIRSADLYSIMSFLEQTHPVGLIVTKLEFNSEKHRVLLEFSCSDESVSEGYLADLESSPLFKNVAILKRSNNKGQRKSKRFKIEIAL